MIPQEEDYRYVILSQKKNYVSFMIEKKLVEGGYIVKKIVIVGGVAGGASCAARLRRLMEDAEIILLERGEYISYANCGLPYYTGDVIKSRDSLLVMKEETMKERYHVDVRTRHEALHIHRDEKTLTILDHATGKEYTESYDILVLSTGSSPMRPPIPGIESNRIQSIWTVQDADRVKDRILKEEAKSAVVIGGGFIGLEMAENLHTAGLQVSIVEMQDQVMAPLDPEMAQLLHENIAMNGVQLHLGDGVKSFQDSEDDVLVTLQSGKQIHADMMILSIGVKPNSELAVNCGLEVNARGGIITDAGMRTSDPHIYAVGDVVEVEDYVSKEATMIPLAGPANKQGRIAANVIAGYPDAYQGTQGTSVAKVFDLTAACTGANEKTLLGRGLVKGKDYESILISANSHAGYYPGATPMFVKLLFSMVDQRLYGAQIVGSEGVDKRIDTLAVGLRMNGGIQDLMELELAYAPPYSSAKDPVNMAGYTADNVCKGLVKFADWDVLEKHPEYEILDVREDAELMAFAFPKAIQIPLGKLRDNIRKLDKEKTYVLFCAIGVRSYNAYRILDQLGYHDILLYPGGTKFYQSTHPDITYPNIEEPQQETCTCTNSITLDCSGLQCPGPIMKVYQTMQGMKQGERLQVAASDPGFTRDIGAWCRRTGNRLIDTHKENSQYVAVLEKAGTTPQESPSCSSQNNREAEGKTIVVFSGDMDKVLASFIIANGAAAMGRPVTMFFTFWGLNVLRKPEKQHIKKPILEAMFAKMMPRGAKKLKLSHMNMGGMGSAMMKKIMRDKNVDSLEDLIRKGREAGIKFVACTMSMDVMGIKEEELIEGVELGGVGAYLGDAEESNVNLFI